MRGQPCRTECAAADAPRFAGQRILAVKGIALYRIANRILVVALTAGLAGLAGLTGTVDAQAPARATSSDFQVSGKWEFGPFAQGGTGVGDRSDYQFFAMGFQLGRVMTPLVHAGVFTGRFEFGGAVLPLWQAYTPPPHTAVETSSNGSKTVVNIGGGTFRGLSVEPVIFRWNFAPHSARFLPWFQAAGGSIYTTHKFPPDVEEGEPRGTSVFNFSPQGGVGFHYFPKPHRSIDLGLIAEHISSASLGDRNPGVNASLQFRLGYTWWK